MRMIDSSWQAYAHGASIVVTSFYSSIGKVDYICLRLTTLVVPKYSK